FAACAPARPPAPVAPTAEVRALWVVRSTLADPDSARVMVRRAAEAGFNTLIVQVRGRGDAYSRSRWEPPPPALAGRNGYDALGRTIREAHRRGLRVHAWINTELVANADSLPQDSAHFMYRRPDLLAVPRPLARELYDVDPRDPSYVQALAAYAQANRDHVEGLYTSPAAPEVKEHIYSVWIDLVERYQLDGLHFDYVRYPAPDYDYSRVALERFRNWLVPTLLLVSAARFGDAENAYNLRFQDWRDWLRRGILDVACPMAYTDSTELFRERIRTAVETAGGARVWAGIGAYRNTVDGTVEQI